MVIDLSALTIDTTGTTPWRDTTFTYLIDQQTGAIGRVVGSEKEPAGAHQFCFWADDAALTLDVGHIVVAFSEEAAVIGVVDEPRRYSDLRTFLDDYFDRHVERAYEEQAPTLRPEILVFTVTVLATKHLRADVTSHRPPISGPVYFATPKAIDYALGREEFAGEPIPALMHTNGNFQRDEQGHARRDDVGRKVFQRTPVWLDEDYLLGPEAGHANWTGQSGLATKTSHALFLTSAVFQTLQQKGRSVAALMFNVKGPDLLWLDKPADPEPGWEAAYETANAKGLSDEDRRAYAALGLEPKPFANFRLFAPFKPGQVPVSQSHAIHLEQQRPGNALNTQRNAPSEADGVVFPILWSLEPLLWVPHKVFDRGDLDDKLSGFVYELRERGIGSVHQLETLFAEIDEHFEAEGPGKDGTWYGHHRFTINKAKNRFKSMPAKLGGLLARNLVEYGSLPEVDGSFSDQELRVVDIAHCNTAVQELIVSSVINQVWKMAEQDKLKVDKLIIFVDELNKYAPGGGQGGLRDTLVDIAARGRHLNVVLFGAQQFRSKVDSEILGNCGTSLYGRVGDEELTNAAYRSLTETAKAELLGLPKGRLLVRHAHFRAPLFGTFPHPPTIQGMTGQRIFNREDTSDPSDGIYKMLQRLLGNRGPAKSDVRNVCDGVDRDILDEICHQVEAQFRNQNGHRRGDPWRTVQGSVLKARQRSH